jgi:hypothetical protein
VSVRESGPNFNSAQVYANWNLPWGWDLGKEWRLQSRLDVSAGWLGDGYDNAAIGSAGPSLVVGRQRLPLSVELGSSPTLLSRHEFSTKDLGAYGEFTSHIGLNWDLGRRWRLGYRLEHISNAGQSRHNPGLNLHVFGVSYRF